MPELKKPVLCRYGICESRLPENGAVLACETGVPWRSLGQGAFYEAVQTSRRCDTSGVCLARRLRNRMVVPVFFGYFSVMYPYYRFFFVCVAGIRSISIAKRTPWMLHHVLNTYIPWSVNGIQQMHSNSSRYFPFRSFPEWSRGCGMCTKV